MSAERDYAYTLLHLADSAAFAPEGLRKRARVATEALLIDSTRGILSVASFWVDEYVSGREIFGFRSPTRYTLRGSLIRGLGIEFCNDLGNTTIGPNIKSFEEAEGFLWTGRIVNVASALTFGIPLRLALSRKELEMQDVFRALRSIANSRIEPK